MKLGQGVWQGMGLKTLWITLWNPLNWDALNHAIGFLWKTLNKEGCMGLVPWHLDLQCKSSWILNDFFIELN
jgi:hypothetical protein